MNEGNRRKWFPETDRSIREMDEIQEKYRNTIRGEIENILNRMDGIGSERITQIKDPSLTYKDIIDTIISRKLTTNWAKLGEVNLDLALEEELVKKYMK